MVVAQSVVDWEMEAQAIGNWEVVAQFVRDWVHKQRV